MADTGDEGLKGRPTNLSGTANPDATRTPGFRNPDATQAPLDSTDQRADRNTDPNGLTPEGGPTEAQASPPKGFRAHLGRLGDLKFLSRVGPKDWSPAKRGAAAIIGVFLIVVAAVTFSFIYLGQSHDQSVQDDAALNSALDAAWNWVDGSEAASISTKPPWLAALKASSSKGAALADGIEAFLDARFEDALADFQKLSDSANPDHRVLSLIAATDLRLLNYGQAKLNYTQALALLGTPPEKGGLKEASDRLGLALVLFHQQDYENSLNNAGISWRICHQLLGPADSKTLAAVNSMATSLMALSRSAVAGDLLLEAVGQAIENGADQNQPIMRDSLSILFLAFEAQGRGEELKALFKEPENPADIGAPQPDEQAATQPADPSATAPATEGETTAEAQQVAPTPPDQASTTATTSSGDQPPAEGDQSQSADTSPAKPKLDTEEARNLIANLKSNHPNSRVLPALALALVNDLTGASQPPCRSPYPPPLYNEILSLCLDVAKGYASVNELNESTSILESLTRAGLVALAEKGDVPKPRLVVALALLASEKAAQNDLASSEAALRQAREVASTMPKDDQQTMTSLIILSLRLSDIILNQKRPPIEAELELVTGLTTIKKLFNNRTIDNHPLTPILYLRLAWLVGSMGRSKDANSYRDQASRSLKAVTKAHPDLKTTTDEIAKAYEENRRGKNTQDTLAHLWRAVLPANRPAVAPAAPEVMRSELAALKLLNRLPEFKSLIDSAIKWSASAHGPDSQVYRRYQSLNLKFLEESGNLPDLLSALDALATEPGTTAEPDRTAIATSALRYKARVLESAGKIDEAIEALEQARIKLNDNQALLDRLPEIEAEINRLNAIPD